MSTATMLLATAQEDTELDRELGTIQTLLRRAVGVRLNPAHRILVRARLSRRIRRVGARSIRDYVDYVQSAAGHDEFLAMVEALLPTGTAFFSEPGHHDFLRQLLARRTVEEGPIRIWSVGCSTGEEAYSLAMTLAQHGGPSETPRIDATDVHRGALRTGTAGRYPLQKVLAVPPELRERYLRPTGEPGWLEVSEELRAMVRFARINLVGDWPALGSFDVVVCRNVLRYLAPIHRAQVLGRLSRRIAPGGHLFVDHGEKLDDLPHDLERYRRGIFRR